MKIAVLGAGAWGTALAISLGERHEVSLWVWDSAQHREMTNARANPRFLPGFALPDSVSLQTSIEAALRHAELAIIVTPTGALRETMRRIVAVGRPVPVVWGCKGFETDSAKLPHQVAEEEFRAVAPYGVLSGPSFAQEVAKGLPTALTLASADESFARGAATQLHGPRLRVYSSGDLVGVEVGGAVKNVMAIAAGICDGMGFGHNARAALITRGLAEIARLGLSLGGRMETFMGLAGAGDLILTCTGDLSRNRRVGLALAQGRSLEAILQELGHVAEGVYTAREVRKLGNRYDVELPITQAVCRVLFEGQPPKAAVEELLSREPRAETD